ncbi:MAG: hypothetical protein INR69_03435 [Mucilaginibacter polytrichastri]|nr:hypothetical protein [Mucilaginibacter polytrichastri]
MPLPALSDQFFRLLILALPVACIAWTITHEEIFRELHELFVRRYKSAKNVFSGKFYYVFTCEYCFSHWVVILVLIITKYHLLFSDWRGYFLGGFAMVWIANCYMSIYAYLRINLKIDQLEAKKDEKELEEK